MVWIAKISSKFFNFSWIYIDRLIYFNWIKGYIANEKAGGQEALLSMKKRGDENKQENYMVYGMCFGMLVGSVAMSICAAFGHIVFGSVCISIGMLLGMIIGMFIKKKN